MYPATECLGWPAAVAARVRFWSAATAATTIMLMLILPNAADAARKIEQIETPLGVKAWLVEERSIPLISVKFTFAGGSMQDPPEKGGLASLLASLISEGAGDLTAEGFARRVSEEGAQIAVSSTRDQLHGGLDALAMRFEASAELLRLALTSPRFEAEAIERARQQRIAEIDLSKNEPRAVSLDAWHAATFPGHVYGRPPNGTQDSVKALSASDIRSMHTKLFARDNLRVVIVGAIDKAASIKALDRIFGALPAKAELARAPKPEAHRIPGPLIVARELPIATAAFGAAGLPPVHPDFPALKVLNHIIGSGDFDATLMEEIRVKRGLAYAVAVSLINDTATSVMLGGMATKNENMSGAIVVLQEVIHRIRNEGPSVEQVENAKLYLTGSSVLDRDTNTKLAGSLVRLWLSGNGPNDHALLDDAVRRVTVEDVRRVARELLSWDRFNLVVVGPTLR